MGLGCAYESDFFAFYFSSIAKTRSFRFANSLQVIFLNSVPAPGVAVDDPAFGVDAVDEAGVSGISQ